MAAYAVVVVVAVLCICLVAEDKVIVTVVLVVVPTACVVLGCGCALYRAAWLCLVYDCPAFGVVGVLHECPLLIVVTLVVLIFYDFAVPQAAGGCSACLVGYVHSLAQQLYTTSGACIGGCSHNTVPCLLLIGRCSRHYLSACAVVGIKDVVTPVVVFVIVEQQGVFGYTLLEVAEVLLGLWRPACLGNGCEAWQGKVLEQVVLLYMLCPECALYTNVVFVKVRWYVRWNGHIVVYRLHVVCSVACNLGLIGIGALATVDVVGYLCGDDGFHTVLCCLQGTRLCIAYLPAHHCAACTFYELLICSAGSEALVPHDYGAFLVALL